jgi:glycosyltransferase involved in cell wall biosynthesis
VPIVAIDARDARGPELRGWGRYTRELVAALRRAAAGGELDLVALEDGGPGPELAFEQLRLPRVLRQLGADVVHTPNCFLPLRRPCPGVVTVHDLAFEQYPEDFARTTGWKYRTFTPRAVRSAERVIVDSEFCRRDVVERYGADPERIRTIPLAPSLARGDAEPPPGPYLLAVGDVRRKKNLVRLVEAFRIARGRGLPHRLVLAGAEAGAGGAIREAAGDAPVELTGYVADDRLDALMRGADLLVHPSLYEGFGLVLLEAMARGCPVACADTTALPETAGGAAELFDPADRESIAAAIGRVAGDPARRAELAERGRARAAGFSWDATASATLAVYRELVG